MGAPALAAPLPLLAEAHAIHNLIADGHKRLRYHVSRGCALRDADSKRAIVASQVPRGEWRPARDVAADGSESDRHLNPYVVRKHLQGAYDVAFEWPSWTSLLVFDVDRHLPDGLTEDECHPKLVKVANEQRDETMAQLWKAFGLDDKQPVVLKTPGGGYHVYLPLCRVRDGAAERTWPAAWLREWVEHHLAEHGLSLRPGVLELFPAGTRLRLPCGQGMVLLDDDLQPVEGTMTRRSTGKARRVSAMVEVFCAAIERGRKPLAEWLERSAAEWDPQWGPWGDREKIEGTPEGVEDVSRHKVDVLEQSLSRPSESGSGLLYGADFVARVQELARFGLIELGTRHDSVLKLTWYWKICLGLSSDEALDRLSDWLQAHDHVSHLHPAKPHKFYRDSMREAAHYAKGLDSRRGPATGMAGRVNVAPRPLDSADASVLAGIDFRWRDDAAGILRHLAGHADDHGRVPHPVSLSSSILEGLCGDRRINVVTDGVTRRRRRHLLARDQLVDLGVLALHTDFSTGRHGKLFTCWYQFGSGQLPQAAADDRLILAERDIEEGRLQVVANDAQPPTVRLEPSPALLPSLLDDDAKTPPWWIRMYTRRVFTPAEFLEADARKVIPGPFRHRYPPSAYRPPAEPNSSPPAELSPAQGPAPAPAPPPLERIPASVENLLETLPAALRGQARRTWASWFREQDEPG